MKPAVSPLPPRLFHAILERPSAWRRLSTSTAAVVVVYAGALFGVIAWSGRAAPRAPKLAPRELVVTLFDAPKLSELRALGLQGGSPQDAPGAERAPGPVLKEPAVRAQRPQASASTKAERKPKTLPEDKPKDVLGAPAQVEPVQTPPPPVGALTPASAPPGATSANADGKNAALGGQGGSLSGSQGAGVSSGSGTGSGVGNGAGARPGPVSGDTTVLPFMDGMTRPVLLSKVDPTYTREARDANVSGLILTKCVITVQGRLQRCRIVKGIPQMDQAVLDALIQWRYSPVLYQGKPAAVEYVIPVRLIGP